MQEMKNVSYHTSNQQKEPGILRHQRDYKDTQIFIDFVEQCSPFECDLLLLRNLTSGMTAAKNVSTAKAAQVEKKILDGMVGISLKVRSLKRKD